jgi:hypothetical protein
MPLMDYGFHQDVIREQLCKQRATVMATIKDNELFADQQTRDDPYIKFQVSRKVGSEVQ